MMDYKELAKALQETDFSDGCPCGAEPLCEGGDCIILQAADAIEKLSKVADTVNDAHNEGYDVGYWAGRRDYEPKWIPVTEALPEEPGTYLVCVHEPLEKEGCLAEYNMSYVDLLLYDAEQGVWQNGQYDAYNAHLEFVDKKHAYFISHWQEKPALPKEVS